MTFKLIPLGGSKWRKRNDMILSEGVLKPPAILKFKNFSSSPQFELLELTLWKLSVRLYSPLRLRDGTQIFEMGSNRISDIEIESPFQAVCTAMKWQILI